MGTSLHKASLNLNSRGITLIEVLTALAIFSIAGLAMMSLTSLFSTTANRSNLVSAMTDIELDAYFMQDNLPEWIANTIDSSKTTFYLPEIAKCLKSTGAVCPTALTAQQLEAILDPEIDSFVSAGKTISTVALKNLQGTKIAGTHTSPVYYTATGLTLNSSRGAAFSVAGYMARDNASGSPGKVLLLMRIAPLSTDVSTGVAQQSMRNRWSRVNLGTRWEVVSNEVFGACGAGQFIYAVDKASGSVQCKSLESSCGPLAYAVGIKANGQMDCVSLPPTVVPAPYIPPVSFNCDSWGYGTTSCTIPGNPTIKEISVGERRSRSGCSIGSDVTWSGGTITVRDGCRATFNVFY